MKSTENIEKMKEGDNKSFSHPIVQIDKPLGKSGNTNITTQKFSHARTHNFPLVQLKVKDDVNRGCGTRINIGVGNAL